MGYNSYFFQDSSVCANKVALTNKVALKKMMWWIFSAFLFVSMTLIQPNPLTEAKRPIPADGDQCVEEGDGCLWNADDKNVTNCCEGLMCELAKTLEHGTCVRPEIPADGDQCLEEGDDCTWNTRNDCCEGLMCLLAKIKGHMTCVPKPE